MPKTKVTSPARSQGGGITPKRKTTRGSRSLCSPALSTASGRLTSLIDQFRDKNMESFALSPLNGRSVLNDNTEIEEPRRKSWWKKLGENSQDVMEVLQDNKLTDVNNIVEEFIDIEVLSQERKNYTLDLPESSDNESINSIVLPQRKLFTQKENQPQKKYGHLIDNRESLAKLHKTNTTNIEKTVNVGTRELFQNIKRSKPIFPAALLNISPNKTAADKTKENLVLEPKPVRNIFGNRPANKRKNMFTDFIVSESEDEIPDIQPKVFGFQKKIEQRRISSVSRGRDGSPTSSITTDIEMDFRMLLPSSTMVENQLEDNMLGTPVKRARLSKLSEAKESEAGTNTLQTNTTADKTKQSNKSVSSKNKSKTSPDIRDTSLNTSRTTRSMLKNASIRDDNVNTSKKQNTKTNKTRNETSAKGNELNVSSSKSDESKQNATLNKSQKPNKSKTRNSPKSIEKEIEPAENIDNVVHAINNETQIKNKSTNKSLPNATTNKSVNEKERTVTIKVHKTGSDDIEQNDQEDDENNFSLQYKNDDDEIVEEAEAHNDLNKSQKDNIIKRNTTVDKEVQETEINKSKSNKSNMTNKSIQKELNTKTVEESVQSQTEECLADDNVDGNIEQAMVDQEIDENVNSHEVSNEKVEHENEVNISQENEEEEANKSKENENNVNVSQENEDEHNESKEATNENQEVDDEENESEKEENESDEEGNESENEEDESEKEENESQGQADESQEIEAKVSKSQEIEEEADESQEVVDKADESHELEVEVNRSHEVNEEANESQEIEEEANESQDIEEEADESQGIEEKAGESQEIEEEANESQEIDEEADKSQEVEDEVNQSQEVDEEANKSQEIEEEANESQEAEIEADVSQEIEEEANESQEIEEEANESQEIEQEANEDTDEEMNEDEEAANEASANISQDNENDEEESEVEVNQSEEVQDDQMDDSDEADKAIASDPEISDTDDNQADEMEVDDDGQSENADEDESQEEQIDELNEIQPSAEEIEESPNVTHDTTGRHRKKNFDKSPEVILHDKTNQMESFTAKGRNTSIRKTKSMIKNLDIRPSLAPPRDSIGFSDGTRNSSAEGSGWDSHRTTRKTLRQTFGKDFTPRKSLRALVMEKSAKRQTENVAMHSETVKFPLANSTEMPEDSNHFVDDIESDHEVSRRTRQTTLEMYLQKIKEQNIEKKLKMEQAVRNSLKGPARDSLSLFKVPNKPAPRRPKPTLAKPKKQLKSIIPFDELPSEVIEDMKYKPPKRFQPTNASWITKRLYKFLETKLEPKYDYKARVRAEKLVETIYHFAKDLRRHSVAPADSVEVLKHELARLEVVRTHFEFYEFFHEFMPREVRVKVVPDIVNKIALPRHGVFSDILRGNTVQG